MIKSELLKSAIADAKAVRVTAYANAKAALQEGFNRRFEAVFAEKLKEEAEEGDELQEVEAPNQVSGAGGEAKGPKTKAVSKGQPKKKSDANTNFKTVRMGCGPTDVPSADNKIDESAEENPFDNEEGKIDESGLTSEDLDEIIKELEAEVSGEEEGQQVGNPMDVAPEIGSEDPEAGADLGDELSGEEGEEGDSPEIGSEDPEAGADLGDEIPGEEGDSPEIGSEDPEAGADLGDEIPGTDEIPGEEGEEELPVAPDAAPKMPNNQDEINLEELLKTLNEEADEEEDEDKEEEKIDEVENHGFSKKDQESKGSVKGYPKTAPEKTSPGSHQVTGKNHNISGKGNIGTGAVGGLSEVKKYKHALNEAYQTIEFLRGQINEVNLLNAKLLYTNKLFKEFATVIDDNYRMKIVESFDLTKSVREVKLAYALLAESLNFGSRKTINSTRSTPKVDSARKSIAKQITEGLASKPVGSTKPSKDILSEGVNEMAERFQKLAGIKKPLTESKK